MSGSNDRKPGGDRTRRRPLFDIYRANELLPENAEPYNRDAPEVPIGTGPRGRPRPIRVPVSTESGGDARVVDEALKGVQPPRRRSPAGVIAPGPQVPGDRRKARRGARLAGVKCLYQGGEYVATATDLSAVGGFISSTWLPQAGERLTILFKFPGAADWTVSILAEVTRVRPDSGGRGEVRGFAVSWLKLRAVGDMDTLFLFLKDTLGIDHEPLPPAQVNNNQWEFIFQSGGLG